MSAIPEGITLGTKVLRIPNYDLPFPGMFGAPHSQREQYTWIDRGNSLAESEVQKPFSARHWVTYPFAKKVLISIRSPVSGLILANDPILGTTLILLPNDEPAPNSFHLAYWGLVDYVEIYKDYMIWCYGD